MRPRRPQPSSIISKVDVSAFASVLVALLALFMFLTGTPHHGGLGNLPKVWHSVSMPGANREDALIVVIMRDGSIYFGNGRTSSGRLAAQIRERLGRGAEKKVYIRAEGRVYYRTVREVLQAVRSAGLEKVAFLVEQRRVAQVPLGAR